MKTVFRNMTTVLTVLALILTLIPVCGVSAETLPEESGYDLWLRYAPITDTDYCARSAGILGYIVSGGTDEVVKTAVDELKAGLDGLLSRSTTVQTDVHADGAILLGTADDPLLQEAVGQAALNQLEEEGYLIQSTVCRGQQVTAVAGGSPRGVLYAVFKLLEMVQCGEELENLQYADAPKIKWRVLDQWDNWNGSIERGYAGQSIYDWDALPETVDSRYEDFARANASVGINTIVINNVNTQLDYIKSENLPKIQAIADVFRKYGIRLALTVRFDSPMRLPGADGSAALNTSDPLDPAVIQWWDGKLDEIYSYIPDFAGLLVKADSEGQPGPSQYGRTHADGANMLAALLKEHNDAIVMWRAFVYGGAASSISSDIVLHAYGFFKPLDGQFDDNVILQSKNGPRDFLAREPVSPLFGGMTETNMGLELQITQEYTGQSTDLCYLPSMWKYYLDTDLMLSEDEGTQTTLSQVIQGNVYSQSETLIAGVANVGDTTNWTGLLLAQANWYGFGRLAWNPDLTEEEITETWVKLTFGTDPEVVRTVSDVLSGSWEIYEKYTSPYAMGMTVDVDTHFNPALDYRNGRDLIRVDAEGVGHNRNSSGTTNAAAQYSSALYSLYNDMDTCPEELLCWFHHVPYHTLLSNGKTLIENIYQGVSEGPKQVLAMKAAFQTLDGKIDSARLSAILRDFDRQYAHAVTWKQAMLSFFEEQSGIPSTGVQFTNLALRQPAFASQERVTDSLTLTAEMAVDGRSDTRWGTNQTDENHYLVVDLGEVKTVNRVELHWENFSMRYVIETATELTAADGSNPDDWTIVAECCGNEWSQAMSRTGETTVLFADTKARYIRMRTLEKNSGLWNSVYEFEVYGDDFSATARYVLANEVEKAYGFLDYDCTAESRKRLQNRIAEAEEILQNDHASDMQLLTAVQNLKAAFNDMEFEDLARGKKLRHNTVNGSNHSGNVADGRDNTYWQAGTDAATPAVLELDFRQPETFDQICVEWKEAAQKYRIDVQTDDAADWVTLQEVVPTSGQADVIQLETPITARRIRLTTLERGREVSIYHLRVYYSAAERSDAWLGLQALIGTANDTYTQARLAAYPEAEAAAYRSALREAENTLADRNAGDAAYTVRTAGLQAAMEQLSALDRVVGDVNGDGMVTVSDVVELRQLIVAGNWTDQQLAAGDLDSNQTLSVNDVVALRRQIVEQG